MRQALARIALEEGAIIPDVRGDRCVHAIIEQARCRACVTACPTGAWVIDDARLGIDPSRCDGCDLCVPACPEAAIVQRFRPATRKTAQGHIAFAACGLSGLGGDGLPIMPCLHAIGITDLLRLARDQICCLVTTAGDCATCPRGQGEGLGQRLVAVNRLLGERGLPPLAHRAATPASWREAWLKADGLARQHPVSRRNFFRGAIQAPMKRLEETLERAEGGFVPPGRLLPGATPGDPVPLAPVIDPALCSGCDACARLCPHAAISLENLAGRAQAYVIEAEQCSDCGICMDLCQTQAVTIRRWGPVPATRIPLATGRCQACGVHFHVPAGRDLAGFCAICLQTDHHRQLFQVLN
jgi:ferredoxin